MDELALRDGFAELNEIAKSEYRQTIPEITTEEDEERNARRIGRLTGVLLKKPFAKPEDLSQPSNRSRAYRSWHLVGPQVFDQRELQSRWEYVALDQLRKEFALEHDWARDWTIAELADYAQYEDGFFGIFAQRVRKYICGEEKIRKAVSDNIEQASGGTGKIPNVTPETAVGAGGLALGVYLVKVIPILGIVGAPVIAGLVLILYTLGIDSFCEWSANLRTDEDEAH